MEHRRMDEWIDRKQADIRHGIDLIENGTPVIILGTTPVTKEEAIAIQHERLDFLTWLKGTDFGMVMAFRAMVERCLGVHVMGQSGNKMANLDLLSWFVLACYELVETAMKESNYGIPIYA